MRMMKGNSIQTIFIAYFFMRYLLFVFSMHLFHRTLPPLPILLPGRQAGSYLTHHPYCSLPQRKYGQQG